MGFSANLAGLPSVEALARIELVSGDKVVAVIENRPGSAGSVRVYAWLAQHYGAINQDAASEGLRLYGEHTEDARNHPGKHPNIDRLFEIASLGTVFGVRRVVAD